MIGYSCCLWYISASLNMVEEQDRVLLGFTGPFLEAGMHLR